MLFRFKFLFIGLLITVFITIQAQTSRYKPTPFIYTDIYGDSFFVYNVHQLPDILDTSYLKINLNSSYFSQKSDTSIRYNYYVYSIQTTSEKEVFDIDMSYFPLKPRPLDILKRYCHIHYLLYLDKERKRIKKVVYNHIEI